MLSGCHGVRVSCCHGVRYRVVSGMVLLQVKVECCPTVMISSQGDLATKQGAVMGEYSKVGDFNGHTSYQGGPANTTLFYRKAGHGPDGWMVGMDFEQNNFIVTTRDKVMVMSAKMIWCVTVLIAGILS